MKKFITLLFLYISTGIYGQIVYEPAHSKDIYDFLDRLSQKGIIEYYDIIKPISRKTIIKNLLQASEKINSLTNVEREELEFYKKEYGFERNFIYMDDRFKKPFTYVGKDNYDRYRLFSYEDDFFKLNISPILGFEYGSLDSKTASHFWNGVYLYGYVNDNIGFSFDFRDNRESGENIDRTDGITPKPGITGIKNVNSTTIEYSKVNAHISIDWDWGSFTLGKDVFNWGYGESGNLVLYENAPSFPYIRLDINPVDWLNLNYIHGWLASDIIDSSQIYSALYPDSNRIVYRSKFIASHSITVTPLHGLDISLGESIVFSDRYEISYLIPVMFFRLADHYLSNKNNSASDNAQMFFNVSSRNHIPNTHLYGTFFIDEIKLGELFNPERQRNQFAFKLGGSIVDPLIDNVKLTVEYTKIYPFVYRNMIQTITYENRSFVLGHWIEHNADLIYGSIGYTFLRGLKIKVWGQYLRKGEDGTVEQQYSQPQPPFLFGLRTFTTYLGMEIKYQILHELFARARFQYTKISNEQQNGNLTDNSYNEFTVALYYGL